MTRSVMFVDGTRKAGIRGWYDRFRSQLAVPTEERVRPLHVLGCIDESHGVLLRRPW